MIVQQFVHQYLIVMQKFQVLDDTDDIDLAGKVSENNFFARSTAELEPEQ